MTSAQREALGQWKAGADVHANAAKLADLAANLFDETPITYKDMDTPNTPAAPFTGDDEDGYEVNRPILIRTRGQLAMLLEVLKGGG